MQVTDEMVRVAKDAFKESCGLTINGDSAMHAALTAALGAMWRPISEAPKDGTEIIATWIDSWPEHPHVEAMYYNDGGWFYSYDGDAHSTPPTHFMPLSSPPAQEEG